MRFSGRERGRAPPAAPRENHPGRRGTGAGRPRRGDEAVLAGWKSSRLGCQERFGENDAPAFEPRQHRWLDGSLRADGPSLAAWSLRGKEPAVLATAAIAA